MTDMSRFKGRSDDVSEVNNYPKMFNKTKYFYSVIKMNFVTDYVNGLCNTVSTTRKSHAGHFYFFIWFMKFDLMQCFISYIWYDIAWGNFF